MTESVCIASPRCIPKLDAPWQCYTNQMKIYTYYKLGTLVICIYWMISVMHYNQPYSNTSTRVYPYQNDQNDSYLSQVPHSRSSLQESGLYPPTNHSPTRPNASTTRILRNSLYIRINKSSPYAPNVTFTITNIQLTKICRNTPVFPKKAQTQIQIFPAQPFHSADVHLIYHTLDSVSHLYFLSDTVQLHSYFDNGNTKYTENSQISYYISDKVSTKQTIATTNVTSLTLQTEGIYNDITLSCLINNLYNQHSPHRLVQHHRQNVSKRESIRHKAPAADRVKINSEVLPLKTNTLTRDSNTITTTTLTCRATYQLSIAQLLITPASCRCSLPKFKTIFFS